MRSDIRGIRVAAIKDRYVWYQHLHHAGALFLHLPVATEIDCLTLQGHLNEGLQSCSVCCQQPAGKSMSRCLWIEFLCGCAT
jgi:hypothetical protein